MGTDTTTNDGATERSRALAPRVAVSARRCAGVPCGLLLVLAWGSSVGTVSAQAVGDTEPAANAQPAAQTPTTASAEDGKALTARVEALARLASGALPNIPLDGLLNVSLDDDSTMLERDAEARLERRRLMIALNQAERSQNKSEAELEQLRDQILALELERKVLALPIEVRERLVEENYKGSQAPTAVPPSPSPSPTVEPEPGKPLPVIDSAAPSGAAAASRSSEGHRRAPWFSRWVLFGTLLLGTFVLAGVVGVALRAGNRSLTGPDPEREQLAAFAQLGISLAGILAAVLVPFSLPTEVFTLILGALVLLAVLALKDVAASVLGGLTLFVQRPFRIGHRVEVGGIEGRVTDMGLLSVRVLGPQQRAVNIPNSEFLTKLVSASPASGILAPIQVDFYIHPNDDIARAKAIIAEVIQSTRGADASKARSGIVVTQIPLNGTVMVRLRAKVFVTGTHPEQEIASELSERVLERLRGGTSDTRAESEHPETDYEATDSQASIGV
jgi:small-conductance mechanosensitive channel